MKGGEEVEILEKENKNKNRQASPPPVISEPRDSKRQYTFNVVSLKRVFLNDQFRHI